MQKTGKKSEVQNDSVSGKVDVVAQELKFAKMLASNDSKVRSKILKSLKKWLNTRSQSSYRKLNVQITVVKINLMSIITTFNHIPFNYKKSFENVNEKLTNLITHTLSWNAC